MKKQPAIVRRFESGTSEALINLELERAGYEVVRTPKLYEFRLKPKAGRPTKPMRWRDVVIFVDGLRKKRGAEPFIKEMAHG